MKVQVVHGIEVNRILWNEGSAIAAHCSSLSGEKYGRETCNFPGELKLTISICSGISEL